MSYRRYLKLLLGSLIAGLALWAAAMLLIDPYFHYHKPWFGMQPVITDNRSQNPGMARHFDYDSIIIGSSMTENFRASWFDAAFDCRTLKLSYEAGRTQNYAYIMRTAFAAQELKYVFFGLDIDPLLDEFGKDYFTVPEYLYDKNPFNDVKYLFNKTILLTDAAQMVLQNIQGTVEPLDEAYTWDDEHEFSAAETLASYWDPPLAETELPADYYLENYTRNLGENILPYIAAHPETEFYIYYPPYSILFWHYRLSVGDVDAVMQLLTDTTKALLAYENVRLYSFLDAADIITDLDNYKDYTHHSAEINRQILAALAADAAEYRLTEENYQQRFAALEELARGYDYDSLLAAKRAAQ